jgi:hypothetical protein
MTQRTYITGSLKLEEHSLLDPHTELSLLAPRALNLGSGSGNLGPL